MDPFWYFVTRAATTLIPLLLVAYGAGLWTGWIKWHTWKREYHAVETDYHKLHDIHDVARATIPELEQRRETLTGEIEGLEALLEQYKKANETFASESQELNQSLRATKRNYEALEEIWRVKLATAALRIEELEALLPRDHPAEPAGTPAPNTIQSPTGPEEPGGDDHRLILFPAHPAAPAPETREATPVPDPVVPVAASGKSTRKMKGRRAM